MAWQSRPVFVSSTFADMQAERDHLRTHVFPALEERLRSRRRHLEWVDLRLGVVTASYQDAETRELQVLKVCLGEVQRCRPFLIVLLGDRYGWVPPPERIAAAAREVGFDENITGRSVTDLEIQFGILSDAEQQPRSFFYFREPLPYADMPQEIAAAYADAYDTGPDVPRRCKRLAALRGEIEARLPRRIRRYAAGWDIKRQCVTGLDAWGQMVLEDIWSEILAATAPPETEAELSWQQAERNALDDYIEDRARDFIGRGEVLTRLEDLASSATQERAAWGLCLTAPPGSGKSAIFGEVRRRLQQNGVFVLAHAAAASARAASVDDMLRRWIEELGAALGTDPGLANNADADTIDATFHTLLGRMAQQRRVVVLVDGLDQFEVTTRGQFATWLPRLWPANARLIATAVPCEASKALEARAGVKPFTLPPLDADEACRITVAICARYHRTLEPEVLEALLAKQSEAGPAWGNTLWLVLAVEELNLVDGDDFGRAMRTYTGSTAEQFRALMLDIVADLPSDVLGLYGQTFERAEKLFGGALAQAFLGFIAISRAGWRESDFRVLLPRATGEEWDELHFASLRRLFRGQIRQRGVMGQWDVNHAQMRAAVRQHLKRQSVSETKLHGWAAQHLLLSLSADDPLRQSETMVHLLGSRDWVLAAEFYGSASLSQPELEGATRVLAEAILASRQAGEMTGLNQVLNILGAVGQTWDNRAAAIAAYTAERLLNKLEPMLAERSELSARVVLLEATRKTFELLIAHDLSIPRLHRTSNSRWYRDLTAAQGRIGDVLVAQGRLSEALASYRRSHRILEDTATALPYHAGWQHDLFLSLVRIGDVLMAQGQLSEALTSYRKSLDIAERLVASDPSTIGGQRDLYVALHNIGTALVAQGQLSEALTSYRQSRDAVERLAKVDPSNATWQGDLSVAQSAIADVLVAQGRLSEALTSYRQSRHIFERLAASDPSNAGWQRDLSVSLAQMGNILMAQGQLPEALTSFRQCLDIVGRLAASDPSNTLWQRDLANSQCKIGDVLLDRGQLSEALTSFRQARDISERLAASDRSNATWQRDVSVLLLKIGDVLVAQGQPQEAIDSYQQCRDIFGRLAASDPSNAGWQRDLFVSLVKIGDVLAAAKDQHAEALASHRQSLDIAERLAASDPSNAGWQRDLSVSLNKVGDLLVAQDQLAEALTSYRQSQDIRERLAASDPSNAAWQRDLGLGFERMGIVKTRLGADEDGLDLLRRGHDIIARLKARSPDDAFVSDDLARLEANIAKVVEIIAATTEEDAETQRALAVSHMKTGDAHHAERNLAAALASYRSALAIFQQLAEQEPSAAKWQRELGAAHNTIGRIHAAQGNLTDAIGSSQIAVSLFERAATLEPGEVEWQRDLGVAHYNIGVAHRIQRRFRAAVDSLSRARTIFRRLSEAEPSHVERQHYLSLANYNLGLSQHADGQFDAALDAFKTSLGCLANLAALAPADTRWQADLADTNMGIGDTQYALGDSVSALGSFETALRIIQHLEDTHGSSTIRQFALGFTSAKTGDIYVSQGNLSAALNSFHVACAAFKRLVEVNRDNTDWQHNLGSIYLKQGEIFHAQGNINAAFGSYHAARVVFQILVSVNRDNAKWQRNLADAHDNIGVLNASKGDYSAAIDSFKTSVLVRDSLIAAEPGNAEQRSYLGDTYRNMGAIQQAQGRFDVALASYDAALSIRKRLVADDPRNAKWQHDLIVMHNDIGDLHRARGSAAAALESYKACLAVAKRLAETDPRNAVSQRDLTVLANKIRDLLATQGNPAISDLLAARATYQAPPATSKAVKQEAPVIDGVDGVDWVRVPNAVRQPVLPVGLPPDRVDGFWFARTTDGQNDDGSLRISPERGYVTGEAARDRLLAYLTGGAMVLDSLARGPDLIDPTRQLAVPARFRTDGTWVWPGSVEYYLRWHNVAPEPELRVRIEQSKYRCPAVETAVVTRARAAVNHRADLIQEQIEAYRAKHPELRPGDPDRFGADVNERLLAIGWTRGRDIGAELGNWLVPRVAELSEKFSKQNGSPPCTPSPAAIAVMREFGGLVSWDNGRGQTSAQVPFAIYPARGRELISFAPDVQKLGETIGSRAFQVGEVERGMAALVVDESGRVFLVGPVQLYVGANIDEALTRMLRGIRCEKLSEVGL